MNECEYEAEQIANNLVGFTITEALLSPDAESFGFRCVRGKQTKEVWVDQDPEGNGPGHLSIE
jgi:hypothetical protein